MNRLRNVLICFLAGTSLVQAQAELNAYKYLIVPTRYENFRQSNQYNTSTLTKYHLTQMGFPAVYDNNLPKDLRVDPCLGLMLSMVEEGNMFRSRLKFVFTDCEGRAVYETREGESKSKDFQEIYKEAIPDALGSLLGMTYTYQPKEGSAEAEAPSEAESPAEVEAAAGTESPAEAEVTADAESPAKAEVPEETAAVIADQAESDWQEVEEQEVALAEGTSTEAPEILYAQPIANGYQLVDSTPAVRMILLNSSRPENYIAMVAGEAKGVVYKEGDTWWHEYMQENVIFKVELKVKF